MSSSIEEARLSSVDSLRDPFLLEILHQHEITFLAVRPRVQDGVLVGRYGERGAAPAKHDHLLRKAYVLEFAAGVGAPHPDAWRIANAVVDALPRHCIEGKAGFGQDQFRIASADG